MALYTITDTLKPVEPGSFPQLGLRERWDLQRLLCASIDAIDPGLMVISEKFGGWQDSRRRIDLLAIDRDARLVVIELKRDDDGGHMELQALRYAATVSTLTFDMAVEAHGAYLDRRGEDGTHATQRILDFLEWETPVDGEFGSNVRIVLVAADFSRETTTTVLFLNERDVDIRCVRLKPYFGEGQVLLDVQQIIPLPEACEYTVSLRQKRIRQAEERASGRDLTKFDVTIDGRTWDQLPKRRAIFLVVQALQRSGVPLVELQRVLSGRGQVFLEADGELDAEAFESAYRAACASAGRQAEIQRWFATDDELLREPGRTCAMTKMWGTTTEQYIARLLQAFPDCGIRCEASGVG
jgi:hypothetical protein